MSAPVLEVELKFPLPVPELVMGLLTQQGAKWLETVVQIDEYLAHPVRSFPHTDEAFRIRTVGHFNCLTYKGPKLDTETKTRREIEVAFAEGPQAREQMRDMLRELGFNSVACVKKQRQIGSINWLGQEIEIALDDVEDAGVFLELEVCCTAEKMSLAKAAIQNLATELNLGPSEQRSYLELCLLHRQVSTRG